MKRSFLTGIYRRGVSRENLPIKFIPTSRSPYYLKFCTRITTIISQLFYYSYLNQFITSKDSIFFIQKVIASNTKLDKCPTTLVAQSIMLIKQSVRSPMCHFYKISSIDFLRRLYQLKLYVRLQQNLSIKFLSTSGRPNYLKFYTRIKIL